MITYGVNKGRITIERLVETCCYNPAKFQGVLPKKGVIAVGSDADIVILDTDRKIVPKAANLYSSSDINVYEIMGVELQGWPMMTILRGKIIMEDGRIVGRKGIGRYIPVKLVNQK